MTIKLHAKSLHYMFEQRRDNRVWEQIVRGGARRKR